MKVVTISDSTPSTKAGMSASHRSMPVASCMSWRRISGSMTSDRMNLWSMHESGDDLRQHTEHKGWDVRFASLNAGRIVYVVAADIWLYDIRSDEPVVHA